MPPGRTLLEEVAAQGCLGRKTGAGWYDYPEGARRGLPAPEVEALIAKRAIVYRPRALEDIQRRALGAILAILKEAALVLDEGLAARPSDEDVTLTEYRALAVT